MSVVLDDDTGERVLLYGADGSTLLKVVTDSSGRLVVVGSGSGGASEAVQDTPDDLRIGVYGRYSGSWQRQPLVFGFSDDYVERTIDTSASAGTNTLSNTATPANTLRVITNIQLADNNNILTRLQLTAVKGGTTRLLVVKVSPAVREGINWQGFLYLVEGDTVKGEYYGATAGDDILIDVHGYDMTLNL
jgi:hypothetical protein